MTGDSMSSISKQFSAFSCAVKKSSTSSNEIKLVLLGKTGSGKSSTANTILGRKVFVVGVGSSSVTRRCRRACGEFHGRHLTILDTPGLLDTSQTLDDVKRELRRSISLLYPGPHVFLLVIRIGRFTQEEKEVVHQLKQAMGSHALSFSVVVFTHGDLLEEGKSVWHCMIDGSPDLAQLVNGCGGRYCVFNNRSTKKKDQVSELFALVDSLLQRNGGNYYSIKMLQKAEEDLDQELKKERSLLDEKEERLKRKLETTIKETYNKELKMIQEESTARMEELKKKLELEKKMEEKLAKEREEAFRQGMEENYKKEKERRIQEMARVMEIRSEKREKTEAVEEKLDQITKMLEEQSEQEEKMRRAMEERIYKDRVENEKKERERDLQLLQKEQEFRQREETKRDILQKELDRLTLSLEEQRKTEQDRKKQMEDVLRRERQENQRERDIQMENQRAEKRKVIALQQELRLTQMKIEQQRMSEENLNKQLEENLQQERSRCDKEISMLKNQCDKKCSELCQQSGGSAESPSMANAVSGYLQEMGLVGLNAALGSVGAPCCVQ